MSKKIKVDTGELQAAATLMEAQIEDYKTLYTSLFSEVEGMSVHWQGADNIAFTEQISEFKTDFMDMEKLMTEYANFLKQCATTYSETQQNIIDSAKTLSN